MSSGTLKAALLLALALQATALAGGRRVKAAKASKQRRVAVAEQRSRPAEPPAAAPAAAPSTAAAPAAAPVATRGPTRIDFDDRLIQGQTNAAGSVYLYDRKELPLAPMVAKRETFLRELVSSVLEN